MTGNSSTDRAGYPAIYLNDHLLGATGGVELARRLADAESGTANAGELARLAADVAEDRVALLRIMDRLGVAANPLKMMAGWVGEKLGRLKPNGRLTRRSPLSSLLELEAMALGVEGKAAGWRSLRALAEQDDRLDQAELDRLIERAGAQRDLLERLRVDAAHRVLTGRVEIARG